MRAVSSTNTPRGPFQFDQFGNVIGDVYIRSRQGGRKDGKLWNKTIKTYPNVSQFWTYDEKWFLRAAGLLARLPADEAMTQPGGRRFERRPPFAGGRTSAGGSRL